MNENIIHEDLVQKNIDFLNLYREEEEKKLDIAFEKLDGCLASYKTSNSETLKSRVSNLKNSASVLASNREEYCNVLKEAIRIYRDTALATVASANKLEAVIK
jgi:hypothetical protein